MEWLRADGRNSRLAEPATWFLTILVLAVPGAVQAQRLAAGAVPEHYSLRFTPQLETARFNGHAVIHIRLTAPATSVTLHAADLRIERAVIVADGMRRGAAISIDRAAETVTLASPEPLAPGPLELELTFSGSLREDLRGFYLSESGGRRFAVTQLQPTDARRMFPVFDEPAFKATFDIAAVVSADLEAISNGPVTSIRPGPGVHQKTVHFATTPRMSSYLVALAVGPFRCDSASGAPVPVRVCAAPGAGGATKFPLAATVANLAFFNDYFAIDYPFAKLDMVAIPDFAAGAMENVGAVFFRESLLIVRDDAPLAVRQRAAAVIAHELAHQWFGNLVTLRWWDDLWLNEGFATWMETKAVASWQPEWDVALDAVQSAQNAMTVDALASTRAVRTAADTPDAINELFDPIAYDKAAALLRMLEAFTGPESWQNGINAYIDRFQYANASAEDFWSTMTRVTGQRVDQILRSYIDEPGVPLVHLEIACRDDAQAVVLHQEPFRKQIGGLLMPPEWTVPACIGAGGEPACTLLAGTRTELKVASCGEPINGNAGATGYYRTQYAPDALERILAQHHRFSAPEHLVIIGDTWALVRRGRADVDSFLAVAGSIGPDAVRPRILQAIAVRLQFLHEYLATDALRAGFETWVRERFARGAAATRSGAKNEASDSQLRDVMTQLLANSGGDAALAQRALARVRAYLAGSDTRLTSSELDLLVPLAATVGGEALYEAFRRRSREADTPNERDRFLFALAAFRPEVLLRRTLELAISREVQAQDRARLIAAVLDNAHGRDLAWDFLQRRWADISSELGVFGGTARIVEALGHFCDRSSLEEIRRFFTQQPVAGAERTTRQTLEQVERCATFAAAQRDNLAAVLTSQAASATAAAIRAKVP